MPQQVDHHVKARSVKVGDVISTKNDGSHFYGATVELVKHGSKYAEAYGGQVEADGGKRQRLFRLPLDSDVWVERTEATDEEKAAQEREWMEDSSRRMLDKMEAAYLAALDKLLKDLAEGRPPRTDLVDATYRGARLAHYAEQVRRGIEVHPDATLRDLFLMLREQLIRTILTHDVPAQASGGFTVSNAKSQIEHEVDVAVVRSIDSFYLINV